MFVLFVKHIIKSNKIQKKKSNNVVFKGIYKFLKVTTALAIKSILFLICFKCKQVMEKKNECKPNHGKNILCMVAIDIIMVLVIIAKSRQFYVKKINWNWTVIRQ